MAGNIVVSQINGGSIGVINAIINGNFQVNQRAVSGTVTLAAGAYGHDRWKAGASGCTYTFATANNITTLTISAGSLIQVIEGNNLFTGTYTLSWTGTAQGKIGGGSYASSGMTGTPAGGSDLNIEFNTGTLSLVQFEPGSVATPFERRPFGQELALCQRYAIRYLGTSAFEKLPATGYNSTSTTFIAAFSLPVPMRASPSLTFSGSLALANGGVAIGSITSDQQSQISPSFSFVGGGGLTTGQSNLVQASNTTSASVLLSAEL